MSEERKERYHCRACGWSPAEHEPDGAWNHCPNCLSSVHVDERPGDRAANCHGVMEPVAVWGRKGGEWAIIHRCKICGKFSSNRVAADDNPMKLMAIALRPYGSETISRGYVRSMTVSMEARG